MKILSARQATAEPDGGYPANAFVHAGMADGSEQLRQANDDIDGGGMLAFLASGGEIGPYIAPEATPAPAEVSSVQAKAALYDAGLYDVVEAALAAHDYPRIRIWWSSANLWRRDHPYIAGLAAEIGISDEQVDGLFAAAAAIVV